MLRCAYLPPVGTVRSWLALNWENQTMRTRLFHRSALAAFLALAAVSTPLRAQLQIRRPIGVKATQVKPVNYLANLTFKAKLEVGMRLLATATQTPYKEGEFMIPFGSQLTITDDQLRAPNLYTSFRWSCQAAGVASAQWQVVQTPSSYVLSKACPRSLATPAISWSTFVPSTTCRRSFA
jgi:hypothetical protein